MDEIVDYELPLHKELRHIMRNLETIETVSLFGVKYVNNDDCFAVDKIAFEFADVFYVNSESPLYTHHTKISFNNTQVRWKDFTKTEFGTFYIRSEIIQGEICSGKEKMNFFGCLEIELKNSQQPIREKMLVSYIFVDWVYDETMQYSPFP